MSYPYLTITDRIKIETYKTIYNHLYAALIGLNLERSSS